MIRCRQDDLRVSLAPAAGPAGRRNEVGKLKIVRVLIIDGDRPLRQTLAEHLKAHPEFDATEAADAAEAAAAVAEDTFDAILIDAELALNDGDLLPRLRSAGTAGPILLIAGSGHNVDTLLATQRDASDVVIKPFRVTALVARLQAQIAIFDRREPSSLTIGPYAFFPQAKLLTRADTGGRIRLTEKEAAILKHLLNAGDRVVPREVLLGEVWGYGDGIATHTLETHIYRLRQKIEPDPARAEILLTDAGGYRLAQ